MGIGEQYELEQTGRITENKRLHGFWKFASYDGEISYELVCYCGFHTPHDLDFENHVSDG